MKSQCPRGRGRPDIIIWPDSINWLRQLIMKRKKRNYSKSILDHRENKVGTNCPICGNIMSKPKYNRCFSATIEHIDRLADGGRNDPTNIIIICRLCNQGRNYTAVTCKNQNLLGYPEWSKISLYKSEFSKAMIATYISKIDSIFWNFVNERMISQSD